MLQSYKNKLEKISQNRKEIRGKLNGARKRMAKIDASPKRVDAILTHVFGVIGEPKPQVELTAQQKAQRKQESDIIAQTSYIEKSKELDIILDTILSGAALKGTELSQVAELLRIVKDETIRKEIYWTSLAVCEKIIKSNDVAKNPQVLEVLDDYYCQMQKSAWMDNEEKRILKEQMSDIYYFLYLYTPVTGRRSSKDYYIAAYEFLGKPEQAVDETLEEEKSLVKTNQSSTMDIKLEVIRKTDLSVTNQRIQEERRKLLTSILSIARNERKNLSQEKERLFEVARSFGWDLTDDYRKYTIQYENALAEIENQKKQRWKENQEQTVANYFLQGKHLIFLPESYKSGTRKGYSAQVFEQTLQKDVGEKVLAAVRGTNKAVAESELDSWTRKFVQYILEGKNKDDWDVDRRELADEYLLVVYYGQITEYLQQNLTIPADIKNKFYEKRLAPELKEWLKERTKGDRGYSDLTQDELVFCHTYIEKIINAKQTKPGEKVAAPVGLYTEEMKVKDVILPWSLVLHQLLYVSGMLGVCKSVADANVGLKGIVAVALDSLVILIIMFIVNAVEGSKIRAKVKKRFSKAYFNVHAFVTLAMTIAFAAVMLAMGEGIWLVVYKVVVSVLLYLCARAAYWLLIKW